MQARLVKRDRSYMIGISVTIPSAKRNQIKLNKSVMKRLVSLQRYLTLPGTEEIIAFPSNKTGLEGDEWIIGYSVVSRFPPFKDYELHELPGGTYFVGAQNVKLESVYSMMKSHWIMTEMYKPLPVLFECYTISGDHKDVQVYWKVKSQSLTEQKYA